MSNRGTVVSLIGIVLCLFFVLWLAGCGGGLEIDPETTARGMLEPEIVKSGSDAKIDAISCVSEGERRWACVVTYSEEGLTDQRVSGSLLCDSGECIWRGDG